MRIDLVIGAASVAGLWAMVGAFSKKKPKRVQRSIRAFRREVPVEEALPCDPFAQEYRILLNSLGTRNKERVKGAMQILESYMDSINTQTASIEASLGASTVYTLIFSLISARNQNLGLTKEFGHQNLKQVMSEARTALLEAIQKYGTDTAQVAAACAAVDEFLNAFELDSLKAQCA